MAVSFHMFFSKNSLLLVVHLHTLSLPYPALSFSFAFTSFLGSPVSLCNTRFYTPFLEGLLLPTGPF